MGKVGTMDRYKKSDGLKYVLQCKCKEINANTDKPDETTEKQFPSKDIDWTEQFFRFEEYMNDKWHKNVNLGAALSGDGLLTDHGVQHISSVIRHAYEILVDPMQLTGYEIFLLLISIHFHDLGNISGRLDHEKKIVDIIEEMGTLLPLDVAEKIFVTAIATAHGGYIDGDKDTIRAINVDKQYDGVNIRCQLLAAILRFADEISDDLYRADFKGIDVPEKNEVYIEYSRSLVPITINGETLKYTFYVQHELTQKKIRKGKEEVYLYDEILDRTTKCMRELEYCKKYAYNFIQLTTMDVTINFLYPKSSLKIRETLAYRLTLHGYPDEKNTTITNYLDKFGNLTDGNSDLKYKNGEEVRNAMK